MTKFENALHTSICRRSQPALRRHGPYGPPRCRSVLPRRWAWVFSAVLLAACGGADGPTDAVPLDPMAVYWRMQTNHHAVTLSTTAPWDTVTLTAIPLTYAGDTLVADRVAMTFTSSDTNAVRVTPDGLVQARQPTGLAYVFVRVQSGQLTYADTVFVRVVDNPAPKTLQSLSFQPVPPDSGKFSLEWFEYIVPELFVKRPAVEGGDMTEVLVNYHSLDPVYFKIDRQNSSLGGGFSYLANWVGSFTVVASAYAYGIAHTDTLELIIGWPLYAHIYFVNRNSTGGTGAEAISLDGTNRMLGVGGQVTFQNTMAGDIHLIFDDTTNIEVVDFGLGTNESINRVLAGSASTELDPNYYCCLVRRFTAPGNYTYRTDRGLTGVIRVIDERRSSP